MHNKTIAHDQKLPVFILCQRSVPPSLVWLPQSTCFTMLYVLLLLAFNPIHQQRAKLDYCTLLEVEIWLHIATLVLWQQATCPLQRPEAPNELNGLSTYMQISQHTKMSEQASYRAYRALLAKSACDHRTRVTIKNHHTIHTVPQSFWCFL